MWDGPFQRSFIECGRQLTKQLNTFNTFFNTNKYKIHNGWDARNVGYRGCKNLQYLISLSDNTQRKYKTLGYISSF